MRGSLCLAALLAFGCGDKSFDTHASSSTSTTPEFRALVYTSPFANRFQLSIKEAVPLESGVLGVAVHVTRESDSNAACLLYLYLDDGLPIAYPPRSTGRIHDLNPETGPLFFAAKLSAADSEARTNRVFEMPVLFLSRSYGLEQGRGVTDGGGAWAFHRDLLPGLNVVIYSVACAGLDPTHGPADVWLLRAGHEGETLNAEGPSVEVAVRIAVPLSLLQISADATSRAAKLPISLKGPQLPVYSVPR